MVDKLVERKESERQALDGKSRPVQVSEEVFLEQAHNLVEVKHGY